MKQLLLHLLLLLGTCQCFVVDSSGIRSTSCILSAATLLEQDPTYTKSFKKIDSCAAAGVSCDDLYDAVRYIDRNASKLYADESAKEQMWKRAYGSWKLQLATGGGKFTVFKPVPVFAYVSC
jgi:hypothetical protein